MLTLCSYQTLSFLCVLRRVYHQSVSGDTRLDLNEFSFFYKDDELDDAVAVLFASEHCLRVCVLQSWPNRPVVYEGTVWVGDSGPEQSVGQVRISDVVTSSPQLFTYTHRVT